MHDQSRSPVAQLLSRVRAAGRLSLWLVGIRDLQWRRRRFALAAGAASLVLALALLLSGVSAAFDNEISRAVTSFHADAWLVRAGSVGPFTSPAPFPVSLLDQVRRLPGVLAAGAVVTSQATETGSRPRQVNVNGVIPGAVGAPGGIEGRQLESGKALVDASLGMPRGSELDLNGVHVRVAALLHGRTYFAGVPTVVVTLADAQRISLGGLPLVTAVVVRGTPRSVPASLVVMTNRQVADDLRRPVSGAEHTISLIRILLWLVAGAILGTFVYLSALERARELAVLKAIGTPSQPLLVGLVLQAVLAGLAASLLAIGLEAAFAPASDLAVEVPFLSYLLLPLVSAGIGVIASLVALRKVVGIDPALAFGGV